MIFAPTVTVGNHDFQRVEELGVDNNSLQRHLVAYTKLFFSRTLSRSTNMPIKQSVYTTSPYILLRDVANKNKRIEILDSLEKKVLNRINGPACESGR